MASTMSSYIPTSGATATRAAETLTAQSANLPWPTPQVIGDELVTNGTFDTDTTGWTAYRSSLSVVDGRLRITEDGVYAANYARQTFSVVSGKVYHISADVSSITGSKAQIWVGSAYGAADWVLVDNLTTDQTVEAVFVAQSATAYLELVSNGVPGGASETADFDNISVKEINPLAVSIQMEGTETFADEGTADQVLLYDRRVDANNRITLSLDTDSTKVGTLTLTMVNGGSSATISTTAELTPGVNDPFNVAIVCTSNEIGIALDGTAETRVSHSIGLPDLSGADATFGGMGTRAVVREWAADITDAGLAGATT